MENFVFVGNPEEDVDLLEAYVNSLIEKGRLHEDCLFIDIRLIMNELYPVHHADEDEDEDEDDSVPFPSELLPFIDDKRQFLQDFKCLIDYLLKEEFMSHEELIQTIIGERPYRRNYP